MAGLRPGHPRLSCSSEAKTWMPGTGPGMTSSASARHFHWLLFKSDSEVMLGAMIESFDGDEKKLARVIRSLLT